MANIRQTILQDEKLALKTAVNMLYKWCPQESNDIRIKLNDILEKSEGKHKIVIASQPLLTDEQLEKMAEIK